MLDHGCIDFSFAHCLEEVICSAFGVLLAGLGAVCRAEKGCRTICFVDKSAGWGQDGVRGALFVWALLEGYEDEYEDVWLLSCNQQFDNLDCCCVDVIAVSFAGISTGFIVRAAPVRLPSG